MLDKRKRQIGALMPRPPLHAEDRDEETAGIRGATREEEQEATEETPGPVHGRRGDLGDSGPGED